MANKKISQLTEVGNVGAGDLFAVSVPAGGPYITKSCEPKAIATYALNPVPSDIPTIGFTGTQNVFFDKSNWIDTSDAGTHAFVMVNKDNGQLTTGSGIGVVANGDNMGDCKATQNVNMQNNSIINIASLFFNQTASTVLDEDGTNLVVQAAQDLTVSGIRHVSISGQALDLASTPISGDMNISRGLNLQGGDVSITNNSTGTLTVDNIVIDKTSRHLPYNTDVSVDWEDSNIQYDTVDPANLNYTFSNVRDGQTVTMYIENTNVTTTYTPAFASGTPNTVLWGGTGGPPHVAPNRTNVYTFAAIHTGIFASAITGYEY
tara:strand:- start:379 stop:1335 length:957 start_codon:yes stop_codon:yes gene_type:complete